MKLKKLLALALVLITTLALIAPAMAANEPSDVIGEICNGAAYFFNAPDGNTSNLVSGRTALGENVVVYILAKATDASNTQYFKIQTQDDNRVGYVKRLYVNITTNGYIPTETTTTTVTGSGTTVSPSATPTPQTAGTGTVTLPQGAIGKGVTTEKVILRKTADKSTASSNRVMGSDKIPANAEVIIYAVSGAFYEISYSTYRGYARSQDITVTAAVQNGQLVTSSSSGGNAGRSEVGGTTPVSSDSVAVPSGLSLSSSETTKWQNTNASYSSAKSKNSDTIGWIYVPGTNINYPIMFSSSFYYNNHTPEKKSAVQGSIYSYTSGLAPITTILGHNSRSSKTMFHQLHHVQACLLGKSKCEKCGASVSGCNRTIFNITLGGYHAWQLFAFYETPHGTDQKTFLYNTTSYSLTGGAKQSYIDFQLQQAKSSSLGKVLSSATSSDPIVCLVVCGDKYYSSSYARLYMFLKPIA